MTARRSAADSIRRALLFAALLLGTSLIFKLARALGAIDDPDLGQRVAMVITGVFLASIGNTTPKTLTPLSRLRCDPATAQALQRFMGWTWVVTGLGFSLIWMVLPREVAKPVSVSLLGIGLLAVVAQVVYACRPRQTRA